MQEKLKGRKGITLIALVITIIVLLILAGVSIAMLTGENGILTQATSAKEKTERAEIIEKAQTDLIGQQVYNGTFGTAESCVGYYADIDGDKNIDGIIYADLAVGGSGTWNSDSWSSYEYAQVTEGLKSYYISSENGTGFGTWEKPVVTAKEGTTGKDRFYVMALEDFNPGTYYCWYDAAYGKLDNPVASDFNDFEQGRTNTTTMLAEWNKGENGKYGAQNAKDMWGVIQEADNTGKTWDLSKWFVPSKAEWAAFGDMAFTKVGVTTSDYGNYGLKDYYWSSAQYDSSSAYHANFFDGIMSLDNVNINFYVRLSATF